MNKEVKHRVISLMYAAETDQLLATELKSPNLFV
jgi:hypothetical protein